MSGAADDLRRAAIDLRTYLRQRQGEGLAWYLDSGDASGAAGAGPPAAARTAVPVSPTAAPQEPAGAERRAPAAAAPRPPSDLEFDRVCRRFVEEALAQLRRQAAPEPAPMAGQQDFFTAAVAEAGGPARLSRAEKLAALQELSAQVAACTRCKLHATRKQGVFGTGDPDADLVLIGEAPGRDEDLQGEPFVGRAGKLLTDILRAIGFAREQVFICNILKSRPPENRDPEPDEVEACEPFLRQQLQIIRPRLICCLGRVAAQNLLKTRASLTALREGIHFYEGVPVVVTYHPAALLRNPNWKRPTWEDVRRLRALHDALVAGATGRS